MKIWAMFIISMLLFVGLAPGLTSGQDDEIITLRVAVQDDLRTTNPLTSSDYWTWYMTRWLYDSPVYFNPENNLQIPYIAVGTAGLSNDLDIIDWDDCTIGNFSYTKQELWKNSSNKEAVVFYEFENVCWHDGVQMDIDDVLFSYHVAAQSTIWTGDVECLMGNNYSIDNWLHVETVWESSDGLRAALRFTLQTSYWHFFDRTLGIILLPEHIWAHTESGQNVNGAKIWCDSGYNSSSDDAWQVDLAQAYENPEPVGSGRFRWELWEQGQYCNITKWSSHFFKDGYKYEDCCLDNSGRSMAIQPYFDGISFSVYKTSEAAILALKRCDIDLLGWSVPPNSVQELANEPGIALQQSHGQGFGYLTYNMRRESFGYNETGHDVGKPLRRAIAHCIDKMKILSRYYLNFCICGQGPVSSIDSWFNETIPRYSFDPGEAIEILSNAGYVLDDPDSPPGPTNHWNNPDGSEIGSAQGGIIKILTPDANYDPIRAQTGVMIAEQLQDVGINAETSVDYNWGISRIEQRDFDIFIDTWNIETDPTVFLYDFFHSSRVQNGLNYPGYQNQSYDQIIELARMTDDPNEREQAVFDAQASICYDLPYDVLYYRTNIEAYRSDRFNGWVVGNTDSIFNLNSILNIYPPSLHKVNAQFVSPPSAVVSNSTTQITVFVKDQDGNPLQGAHVILSASSGKIDNVHANTTSTGKATFTFTASYADPNDNDAVNNGSKVIIQIKEARYWDGDGLEYDPAPSRQTVITVYPEEVSFLCVKMTADPDIIDQDIGSDNQTFGFTYIEVEVTNQNGEPVRGAIVAISVSPAILTVLPIQGNTDQDGKVVFTITAIDLPNDDGSIVEYLITAYAEHPTDPNIRPGDNSMSVYVVDKNHIPPPPPPPPKITYWNEAIILICGISLVAVIYAAIYRKKKS